MLKRTLLRSLLVLAVALVPLAAAAQTPAPKPSPAAKPAAAVKTIFDYAKELGLTGQQTTDLKAAIKALQDTVAATRPRMEAAGKQLNQMIASEAPIDDIKKTLVEYHTLQIDLKLADIATARRVNAILTKEQLAKWRDIQVKARKAAPAR